jgi:hypothetical protein
MSTVIEQAVQARLVATAPRTPTVSATLHYDPDDPYAVRMVFPASATLEGVEVCWTFARDLLSDGLEEPAGSGDVRVRPGPRDRTVLEFRAPEGVALVQVPTRELRRFLRRTTVLVVPGQEDLLADLDRDLAQLMRDIC